MIIPKQIKELVWLEAKMYALEQGLYPTAAVNYYLFRLLELLLYKELCYYNGEV